MSNPDLKLKKKLYKYKVRKSWFEKGLVIWLIALKVRLHWEIMSKIEVDS